MALGNLSCVIVESISYSCCVWDKSFVSFPLMSSETDFVVLCDFGIAFSFEMRFETWKLCIVCMCTEPCGHIFLRLNELRREHPSIRCSAFWRIRLPSDLGRDQARFSELSVGV